MKRRIEITKDNSHTIFVPDLNEHYHSTNGAIQEAKHVFIDAALNYCNKSIINILEIGFGTGLNSFLALQYAELNDITINYTSLELYPIEWDDVKQLNYPELIDKSKADIFANLHQSEWEVKNQITPRFSLLKNNIDFSNANNFSPATIFDVVFFDAFGPDKQPEMWGVESFTKVFESMSHDSVLTTYSAKGSIRRMLQNIGFKVERIPGPPGKREMLRALKI